MTAKILPIRRPSVSVEEMSDEALLAACALGERSALGALFDRHYDAVRGFLFHLVGCDAADLDDLVQNTFETVQRTARRFEKRSAVKTWILGIARNIARRWMRTRLRRRRIELQLLHEPTLLYDSSTERAMERERMADLAAAAGTLSPKLREAFILVYLQGLSGTEAAEVLGVREGAIWKRLHEARKKVIALVNAGGGS